MAEGILEKSGTWFTYGTGKIGQGRESARKYLKEHKDAAAEIEGKVREKLGILTKKKTEK